MLPTPNSLIFLIVFGFFCGGWLTFLMRAEWQTGGRVSNAIGCFEHLSCLSLMVIMIITAILQIVSRYILADFVPEAFVDYFLFPWTEEFSRLCMVWLALIGPSLVQREEEHICMTAVFDLFPTLVQKYLRVAGDIIALVIFVILAWLGWVTARGLDIMFTIEMGFPLSVFAYPIPLGASLMALHCTRSIFLRLMNKRPSTGNVTV